jgi:hypothetical protein
MQIDPKTGKRYMMIDYNANGKKQNAISSELSKKQSSYNKYNKYDKYDNSRKSVNLLESDSSDSNDSDNSDESIAPDSEQPQQKKKNVKSNRTATDMLTNEEIKERLKNYERVNKDDAVSITPGTRVQYFEELKDGSLKYRPGGTMIVNKSPTYMVMSNGRITWSIQLEKIFLFKEKDYDALKKDYEEKLKEKDLEITSLRKKLGDLINGSKSVKKK